MTTAICWNRYRPLSSISVGARPMGKQEVSGKDLRLLRAGPGRGHWRSRHRPRVLPLGLPRESTQGAGVYVLQQCQVATRTLRPRGPADGRRPSGCRRHDQDAIGSAFGEKRRAPSPDRCWWQEGMSIPFEGQKLADLACYIAPGLAWHHCCSGLRDVFRRRTPPVRRRHDEYGCRRASARRVPQRRCSPIAARTSTRTRI